jgi:hypothetical protein
MKAPVRLLWLPAVSLCVISCGTMGNLKNKTTAGLSKVTQFSVTDLMPSRIKVVEPREKDLRPLPTGEERAMAYAASHRGSRGGMWGFFRGPVDFKEPALPADAGLTDGSLLPPLEN